MSPLSRRHTAVAARALSPRSAAGAGSWFTASGSQVDHSTPPPLLPPPSPATSATSAQDLGIAAKPAQHGLTSEVRLGLGMIPVFVCACAIWIGLLFWWRKRRVRNANRHETPPAVREKDYHSTGSSIESSRKSSGKYSVTTFSTPVYSGAVDISRDEKYALNARIARLQHPALRFSDADSLVDVGSPFRLKRDDTVRRGTLGTEISSLWPSPPPSAWIGQANGTVREMSPDVQANYF